MAPAAAVEVEGTQREVRMDDCREDEMDEIAYNWWTSAGSPKSVSIRDAFIAGWDAAVQALAKLTEERAASPHGRASAAGDKG